MAKNKTEMTQEELEKAEETFVAYYKISGNATQSAEKAGFEHPHANGQRLKAKLLKHELIDYIDVSTLSKDEQKIWVKQFFVNVMGNGKISMRDRITCARTLAQILKMFDPDNYINDDCVEALSGLSYEELTKIIENRPDTSKR